MSKMAISGLKWFKIFFNGFNLIFGIAGICLIATGATVLNQVKYYFALVDEQVAIAIVLLIAVGAIIIFTAAFGCFGAWKENNICILVFAFLLGITFVLEIYGGMTGYIYHNEVENTVKDLMRKTQKEKIDGDVWDTVQKGFKCCGIHNYTEWEQLMFGNAPMSCCEKDNPFCTGASYDIPSNIYTEPCLTKFETFVKDNILTIGEVGIGLAFVQIPGMLICCLYFCSEKKRNRREKTAVLFRKF